MNTTPAYTTLKMDQITGRFEDVPCTLEEAGTIHLGDERFYILKAEDGSRAIYAYNGVNQYRKQEVDDRARVLRDLGYDCDVYQFTWPVHENDPIYTIKLPESILKQATL
jgi:hypothetical protein